MKRLLNIAIVLLLAQASFAITHTYTSQSVLSSGKWIKIRVSESGVYQLTYEELKEMGLQPENVRIYGYGGAMLTQNFNVRKIDDLPAVRFHMEKGNDGVFGAGDYILFYGQGSIGWDYSDSKFTRTRNPYSDYGYYFLSDNAGEQLLMQETRPDKQPATDVYTYQAHLLHEKDILNLIDPNGVDGGGREFYGESMTSTRNTLDVEIPLQDVVEDQPIRLYLELAAKANVISTFTIKANNLTQTRTTTAITDFYTMATTAYLDARFNPSGTGSQTVNIKFNATTSGPIGYLNYVAMTATCSLTMRNSELMFRTTEGYLQNTMMKYHLGNVLSDVQVWNITHLDDIRCEPSIISNGELTFYGSNTEKMQEYIAVKTRMGDWRKPTVIGEISNQNLHSLENIDYVIISPEAFVGPATELAKAHEEMDHITWAVVTDQQVYNEFSSGTPDASAYRWIMKMLYDRANGDAVQAPKWLLLMGDGTFDNRKLLATSGPSLLLTFEAINSTNEVNAYATDDYFGFMQNTDGAKPDKDSRMNIGVGRLPVANLDEAQKVVEKIIRYMRNEDFGRWKQQILFLADDGDNGLHTEVAEEGAKRVQDRNPDFVVNKIYLDAYPQEVNASGESYPLAKNRLDNLLKDGVLLMDYSGHGGYNNITNEGMMSIRDVQMMSNKNQAVWMMATCSFSHFDSGKRCTAEEAVLNPNGGAIAVVGATRTVYASENAKINRFFCDTLFSHKDPYSYDMTVGSAMYLAKSKVSGGANANHLAYVLLGDPALKLNYPTNCQVHTTSKLDTLNALTIHNVEGYISENSPQDTATWFNGKVQVTIYDKKQIITTRDNDEKDPSKQKVLKYEDYPNTIYKGEANVKDGKFQYVFMTPKDIRYNYGNGRMVYYAYDENEHVEGVGHFTNFVIGGSNSEILADTVGPELEIYLNTPLFKDGDATYEKPRFYANIFDKNGVNTAGSGIGHDLMLIIDDDPKQTYILNEFFTFEPNSYRGGQVSYQLPELTEGEHTLTFRAWDLVNNSTLATLKFKVVKGLDPTIFNVACYTTGDGDLHMSIQYDQVDELMDTEIYIYNMQGQLVYSHQQNNANDIATVALKQLGIGKGLYIYNVRIRSANGSHTTKSGKLIITH